ncbi:hypothetical protein LZ24_03185 [Desulfobotulus alkaliphilus]|uniref:Uncharacterized protein n=1 Tax=Desulfobotulus alkaliphilus TaxID=622671 RepID=A0A562R4H8_9BACT|nr:hypothetical protein [Desulfobotulus alkaliphilus]TWI63967.1 hypothetical protein LZ24_03185 [Desulfobotulus alkaliphilus]
MKPSQARLYPEYPASIWLLGLLLMLKALFWLFANPLIEEPLLGMKHVITTLPFLFLWRAVWNRKSWAVKAAMVLTAADLVFFLLFFPSALLIPFDIYPIEVHAHQGLSWFIFAFLNILITLCSAMIGYAVNIMILITGFFALKKTAVTEAAS